MVPQNHDIQVVNKLFKTLQQEFTFPKLRPSIEHQLNVTYKIPCADWDWCYVSETSYCFESHKKEHSRNVETCANRSNIVKHAWSFDHRIDLIFLDILVWLEKLWRLGTLLLPF